MKRILSLTAIFIMALTLSACQLFNLDGNEDVLEYALIATDGSDLEILDQYPNLEYVDFRGSTCYEEIFEYCAAHPDIKVRFSIALGQMRLNQDVTELTLSGTEVTFEDLKSNLKYFQFLKTVHFDPISITKAQFEELQAIYPQINFTYSIKLGNDDYDDSVESLNISQLSAADVKYALCALDFLPNLTTVDMMDSYGHSKLTPDDAKAFMDAYPQIRFNYQIKLFGQTLTPQTEKVIYKDIAIGDNGLAQLREAMALMTNCTYVCLDNCKISDEAMDKFRADFPNVKVAWRVFVDQYSVLTDTEVILMQNSVNDDETQPLKYCTYVKYLDMTSCKIKDFSFLSGMENLECVVLYNTPINDLSVLRNCKDLIWLDLAACTALVDISPLADLDGLKYLNLSGTKVEDLAPLDQLPLERFKCAKSSIDKDELDQFQSKHSGCVTTSTGNMTGLGWRFNDGGQREPFEYYAKMREVFGYRK